MEILLISGFMAACINLPLAGNGEEDKPFQFAMIPSLKSPFKPPHGTKRQMIYSYSAQHEWLAGVLVWLLNHLSIYSINPGCVRNTEFNFPRHQTMQWQSWGKDQAACHGARWAQVRKPGDDSGVVTLSQQQQMPYRQKLLPDEPLVGMSVMSCPGKQS